MNTSTFTRAARLAVLAASSLAVPALGACGFLFDGDDDEPRDTHTSRPDADVSDTQPPPIDTGPDTSDGAWLPPRVVEVRGRPGGWGRFFYVTPDGGALIVPVEAQGSIPGARRAALARFDAATLARTEGPTLAPGERAVELFPSADPDTVWFVDYGAATIGALDTDSLTLGELYELPDTVTLRVATWAIDGRGAAWAYHQGAGEGPYTGVFSMDLPEDPSALTASNELRSVTIAPSDFLRARYTSAGVLALSGAPSRDQGNCVFCFDEPDQARAFFHVYELHAEVDPREPRIEEAGLYDDSFRVAPTGRWLYRQDAEGGVAATDMEGLGGPPKALPCVGTGLMELAPDGRVLCVGPSTFATGPSVFHLDSELAVVDEVDVPAAIVLELVPHADFTRVFAQGVIVDLSADPATIIPVDVSAVAGATIPGRDYLWIVPSSSDAPATITRVDWQTGTVVVTSVSTADVVQLEALADGFALVRATAIDRIEVYDHNGLARGVIDRMR